MSRLALIILSWLLMLIQVSQPAQAERRVALVIGNATYKYAGELTNPRNDAEDVAEQLKRLGFDVVKGVNLAKTAMDTTIRDFASKLLGADSALFFYAGHALQVGGVNYLVPIDAQLTSAAALDFETVRLDLVQRTMERETKTNILFLDACRDNPLARNLARAMGTRQVTIGRGLAAIESGAGTLIGFSTQPGNVALDGDGRNSPYAGALVKQLKASQEDISTMLIGVRNEVMTATRERQIPWEHSALRAKFFFARPIAAAFPVPPSPSVAAAPPPTFHEVEIDLAYWEAVKDAKDSAVVQMYLDQFPNGRFVPLAKRLIAKLEQERAQRLASLPPVGRAKEAAAEADRDELVRNLQAQLKRVGCDPGAVDGQWGSKARKALSDFAKYANLTLPVEEPTSAARDAVAGAKDRVCPLQCEGGEVERDGRCVAGPKAKADTPQHKPKSAAREAKPATKPQSEGMCWSPTGREGLRPCSELGARGSRAY